MQVARLTEKQREANRLLAGPTRNIMLRGGSACRGGEPISALYEQGKVHHVGDFPDLEDQMCNFTPSGYLGEGSPDRADALVWALTELMLGGSSFTLTNV